MGCTVSTSDSQAPKLAAIAEETQIATQAASHNAVKAKQAVVKSENTLMGSPEHHVEAMMGFAFSPKEPVVPGNTKAVIVGCNYAGVTGKEIYGAINDAFSLRKFIECQGWPVGPEDCRLLVDDETDSELRPTKENIVNALKWLLSDQTSGDSLFFAFSGHAMQLKDLSGDEKDGMDEAIITADLLPIVDDELYELLVKGIKPGVLLTIIMDCCNSGTVIDLPHCYSPNPSLRNKVSKRKVSSIQSGQVVCISAAQDGVEAQDVKVSTMSGGAATNAFISTVALDPAQTYFEFIDNMYLHIKHRGVNQVPQLSSLYEIKDADRFCISVDSVLPLPAYIDNYSLNPLMLLMPELKNRPCNTKAVEAGLRPKGWLDGLVNVGAQALQQYSQISQQPQKPGQRANTNGGGGGGIGGMLMPIAVNFGTQLAQNLSGANRAQQGTLMNTIMQTGVQVAQQMLFKPNMRSYEDAMTRPAPTDIVNPNIAIRNEAKARGYVGKKKSLLIGINYRGHNPGELRGCINDVKTMVSYITLCGYRAEAQSMLVLTEEQPPTHIPTKANIENAISWLVGGVQAGDELFFHYSGHGTQTKDDNGDEKTLTDECIVPLDYKSAGLIRDDFLYKKLVEELPKGVRLTVILDCCHSGTGMDLPYIYQGTQWVTEQGATGQRGMFSNPAWDWKSVATMIAGKLLGPQAQGICQGLLGMFKPSASPAVPPASTSIPPDVSTQLSDIKMNLPDVVMISGCRDEQTSADVGSVDVFTLPPDAGPGGAGGACTCALIGVLRETRGRVSWADLIVRMRQKLAERRFEQVPQLSSSYPIPLETQFFIAQQ